MTIEEYIETHIDDEDEYLHQLYRATQTKLLYGRMASGHQQGLLLKMFVQMIKPNNVLEIGTYSGYSALCMAKGLNEGGMVYTIDIFDELEDFTRPWISNSPWADKVKFYIGDAMEFIPKIGIKYDMAFIDGNKRKYLEYYDMVIKYMNPEGFIFADNTLWDGHVLETPPIKDSQTRGIMSFNDFIAKDERVEKTIIPIRDGLTIIKLKK